MTRQFLDELDLLIDRGVATYIGLDQLMAWRRFHDRRRASSTTELPERMEHGSGGETKLLAAKL